MNLTRWPVLRSGASSAAVKRLQCLLTRQGYYDGALTSVMDSATVTAVRAMRKASGMSVRSVAGIGVWTRLHTHGGSYLMKYGASGETVRRLQRALDAVFPDAVKVTGSFVGTTTTAVKRYQGRVGMPQTGVVTPEMWQKPSPAASEPGRFPKGNWARLRPWRRGACRARRRRAR